MKKAQPPLTFTRTTDSKARVSLPRTFANATVLIESISDTEVRVRKARVVPEDDFQFLEETTTVLTYKDRDLFLAMLDSPPKPNQALKRLLKNARPRHG